MGFNTVITDKDLVNDSTLEPENGGTQKTFFIKDSLFTVGEKYVLALRAVDEKQNQGQVSNAVQIFLPAPTSSTAKPSPTHPTTPSSSPKTTPTTTPTTPRTTPTTPKTDPTTPTTPTTSPSMTAPSSSSRLNNGIYFSLTVTLLFAQLV